jgi:hypothetical protein
MTGPAGQGCQHRAASTGLPAQGCQHRTFRIRKPGGQKGEDSQKRIVKQLANKKNKFARTGHQEQDSQNGTARTGQAEQDRITGLLA